MLFDSISGGRRLEVEKHAQRSRIDTGDVTGARVGRQCDQHSRCSRAAGNTVQTLERPVACGRRTEHVGGGRCVQYAKPERTRARDVEGDQ